MADDLDDVISEALFTLVDAKGVWDGAEPAGKPEHERARVRARAIEIFHLPGKFNGWGIQGLDSTANAAYIGAAASVGKLVADAVPELEEAAMHAQTSPESETVR